VGRRAAAAGDRRAAGPLGALYFDVNLDGRVGPRDFLPQAMPVPDLAGHMRFAYSPALTREAAKRLNPWPAYLLTPDEAAEYWSQRDAAGHFLRAAANREKLLAMVLATARDHALAAPDHPHVVAAYQGWLEARVSWLRLNPDASYVAAVQA